MGIPHTGRKELLHAVSELFPGAVVDIRLKAPDRLCRFFVSGRSRCSDRHGARRYGPFGRNRLLPLSSGRTLSALKQDHPENAGRLVVPFSCPVADSRDVCMARNLICCLYGGQKCGSRRRHALSLPVLMDMKTNALALCNIEDSWNRNRKNPVLAADHTRPFSERRNDNRIRAETVHEHRAGDDINDRINCADLMKMHFVHRHVVGLCLRLRENPENLLRKRPRCIRHVRLCENLPHIRIAPVLMVGPMAAAPMAIFLPIRMRHAGLCISRALIILSRVRIFASRAPAVLSRIRIFAFRAPAVLSRVRIFASPVRMDLLRKASIKIGHVVVVIFMRPVKNHMEIKAGYARLLYTRDLRPKA